MRRRPVDPAVARVGLALVGIGLAQFQKAFPPLLRALALCGAEPGISDAEDQLLNAAMSIAKAKRALAAEDARDPVMPEVSGVH